MKTQIKLIQVGLLMMGLLLLPLAARAQTLGTTNLLEGPTAGSDSVVLKMTGTWTASPNAAWLHLSTANQSGAGHYQPAKQCFLPPAMTGHNLDLPMAQSCSQASA